MKINFFDMFLVSLGVILVCTGIYRMCPVKIDSRFLWSNGPLTVGLACVLALAWKMGGTPTLIAGVKGTLATSANFLPLLILLIPLIGFSTPLAKFFEAELTKVLSGTFGYPAALLSSVVSPSSSAFMGVVNKLWETRSLHGVLLYFATISPLVSMNVFMIRRIGITNEGLAYSMYTSSIGMAFYVIPFFYLWGRYMTK